MGRVIAAIGSRELRSEILPGIAAGDRLVVFGPRDRFLQFFNLFHYTTRGISIEREVTLQPGERWDDTKILETERRLRDPILTARVVVVPVRSAAPGTVDLLVVTRDVWSLRMNSNYELQAGKLTGLGVGTLERLPALPNVPAIAETVPGFNVTPWVGVFAPAKTPKEIAARISKEVDALLKDPAVVKNFADQQIRAAYLDTPAFTAEIKKETDAWEKVIKTLGIKVE